MSQNFAFATPAGMINPGASVPGTAKKPVYYCMSVAAALISFAVPFGIYFTIRLLMPDISDEDHPSPGNAMIIPLVGIPGLACWALFGWLSLMMALFGVCRKERGPVKYVSFTMTAVAMVPVAAIMALGIWSMIVPHLRH